MRAKKSWRCITAILFFLLACVSCLTAAFAYENIDPEKNASLRIYFGKEGKGYENSMFCIYRVADVTETGGYRLTGDFKEYPVVLEGLTSSEWRALAQTLDSYAARDSLTPLQNVKTDEEGWTEFSGLIPGLYLVKGEPHEEGGYIHTPEPLLACLPGLTEDAWDYDVEVSCKFDSISPGTVSRRVLKIWKDDGNEAKRPEEISVQLLENGKVVDTVVLNKENHWEHTWENLDGSSQWQVAEYKTPEGYTVSVAREGTTFLMTNTYPPDTPPKIPQTGMLWWPVPLLVCGGLLFVVLGCRMRRRNREENDK